MNPNLNSVQNNWSNSNLSSNNNGHSNGSTTNVYPSNSPYIQNYGGNRRPSSQQPHPQQHFSSFNSQQSLQTLSQSLINSSNSQRYNRDFVQTQQQQLHESTSPTQGILPTSANYNQKSQHEIQNTMQSHSSFSQQQIPPPQSAMEPLYERINYLQKQLYELTRILQQQQDESRERKQYSSSSGNNESRSRGRNDSQKDILSSDESNNGETMMRRTEVFINQEEYEELGMENAQLTIQKQELEEENSRVNSELHRAKHEIENLEQELEKQHQLVNEFREKMIHIEVEKQSYLEKIQRLQAYDNQNQNQPKQPSSQSNLESENQEIARLNEEISDLLQKLHNTNELYNQEQGVKEELMAQLNEQNLTIEGLRKDISEKEIENQYLKQEVRQIEELANEKQREIQDRYIKKEVEDKYYYEKVENDAERVKKELQKCLVELEKYRRKEQKSISQSRISNSVIESQTRIETQSQSQSQNYITTNTTPTKPLNNANGTGNSRSIIAENPLSSSRYQQYERKIYALQSELRIMEQELHEEREKHQLIKNKYVRLLEENEQSINKLQIDNRNALLENRKLQAQLDSANIGSRQQSQLSESRLKENERKLMYYTSGQYKSEIEQEVRKVLESELQSKVFEERKVAEETYRREMESIQVEVSTMKEEILKKEEFEVELRELNEVHEQLLVEVRKLKLTEREKSEEIERLKESIEGAFNQTHPLNEKISALNSELSRLQMEKSQIKTTYVQKILQFEQQLQQKQHQISVLEQRFRDTQKQLQQQQERLNSQSQAVLSPSQSCINCKQIIKEFTIYKQLMEIKLQSQNEMIDDFKICFEKIKEQKKEQHAGDNQLSAQSRVNVEMFANGAQQEIVMKELIREKTKYEYWLQRYEKHDQEYQVLKERIWEWEKMAGRKGEHTGIGIQQQNQQGDSRVLFQSQGSSVMSFGGGNSGFNKRQNPHHPPVQTNNGVGVSQSPNRKSRQRSPQAGSHLSNIEYDLHLIKLQNSTLRSQVSSLQKSLSAKAKQSQQQQQQQQSRHNRNRQESENQQLVIRRQLQQLKKLNDNLLYENEELKSHLNQVVSEKSIMSSRQNIEEAVDRKGMVQAHQQKLFKDQTIYERYSSILQSQQQSQSQIGISPRNNNEGIQYREQLISTEKTLKSAQILIEKLKVENDKLIGQNRVLNQEIDQISHEIQHLQEKIKHYEEEQIKTNRYAHLQKSELYSEQQQNNSTFEFSRHDIPQEYIKYHPLHKSLQNQYVTMKRQFSEFVLESKRDKEYLEEEVAKMRIENQHHKGRIEDLLKEKEQDVYFGGGRRKNFESLSNGKEIAVKEESSSMHSTVEIMKNRIQELQKEVTMKIHQCQRHISKIEELERHISSSNRNNDSPAGHESTPRRTQQQQLDRISRIVENIDVSPIQSPKWQQQQELHQEEDQINEQIQRDFRKRKDTQNQEKAITETQMRDQGSLHESIQKYVSKKIKQLGQVIDRIVMILELTPPSCNHFYKEFLAINDSNTQKLSSSVSKMERSLIEVMGQSFWLLETVEEDLKQQNKTIEMLREQKKQAIKERNQLRHKEDAEEGHKAGSEMRSQFLRPFEERSHQNKRSAQQPETYSVNRIPKLNFDTESNGNQIVSDGRAPHSEESVTPITAKDKLRSGAVEKSSNTVLMEVNQMQIDRRRGFERFNSNMMQMMKGY